jgi:hypothetical protein
VDDAVSRAIERTVLGMAQGRQAKRSLSGRTPRGRPRHRPDIATRVSQ